MTCNELGLFSSDAGVYSESEVLDMRTSVCLLLLAIGLPPLDAQPERRGYAARYLPPEIISSDELPRDILRVAPSRVRVDFENDRTRVLRLTLLGGEALPMHDDRAGVLVCIAGCRIRFGTPDGKTQDVELKAGETQWMPDARRVTLNLAAGPVEVLYIESKRPQT
jgi:hypothetical protein